jgi:hypothetical protein
MVIVLSVTLHTGWTGVDGSLTKRPVKCSRSHCVLGLEAPNASFSDGVHPTISLGTD